MRATGCLVVCLFVAGCGDEGGADPADDSPTLGEGGTVSAVTSSTTTVDSESASTTGEPTEPVDDGAAQATASSPDSGSTSDSSSAGPSTSSDTGTTTSSGAGGTGTGADTVSTTGDSATLSFAEDIFPVFDMTRDPVFVYPGGSTYTGCTDVGVCHAGERPGAMLSMPDAATAYAQLLEQPSLSALCDGTVRVVPGDPDVSCLILFYEGRLRDELDWVNDEEIDLVREWIRQGAAP